MCVSGCLCVRECVCVMDAAMDGGGQVALEWSDEEGGRVLEDESRSEEILCVLLK